MKSSRIRRAAAVLAIPLTILALVQGLHQSGVRVNLTSSEPIGFYLMKAFQQATVIERGSLIGFCPAIEQKDFSFVPKGDCPGGAAPFLKHVIGLPGDAVEETDAGVWINGKAIEHSKPRDRTTAQAMKLPHWRGGHILEKNEYWVYGSGNSQDSFDSRYYGPVQEKQIISIQR